MAIFEIAKKWNLVEKKFRKINLFDFMSLFALDFFNFLAHCEWDGYTTYQHENNLGVTFEHFQHQLVFGLHHPEEPEPCYLCPERPKKSKQMTAFCLQCQENKKKQILTSSNSSIVPGNKQL